jgi:peptide/nickel transport system permease protein
VIDLNKLMFPIKGLISRLQSQRAIALSILALIVILSVLAPWIAPHDPLHAETGDELKPPSAIHPFGTDLLGRDVYSRVLYGGRSTLSVAGLALALAVLPGLVIGLIAGYTTGMIDEIVTVVLDALLAFPALLLALTIVAIVGGGPLQVGVAVGLAGIPPYARVVRAAALSVRAQPFVEAARAIGAMPGHIVIYHVAPNLANTLVGFATVILSWAILNAATLNFLGFGGDPSVPEWGSMLASSRQAFRVAPWAAIAPGVAIMVTLFAVNLVADTLTRHSR